MLTRDLNIYSVLTFSLFISPSCKLTPLEAKYEVVLSVVKLVGLCLREDFQDWKYLTSSLAGPSNPNYIFYVGENNFIYGSNSDKWSVT